MPIKLDCPRCEKPLSVPRKKAGSYVQCPECMGRLWVPEDLPSDTPSSNSAIPSPGLTLEEPVAPPVKTLPSSDNSASRVFDTGESPAPVTEAAPSPNPTPPGVATPPPPPPERKVARFISGEVARSTLEVAENGQLPELQLQASEQKKKESEPKTTTINPLVLFGVISMSVVFSILLVLYEPPDREPVEVERAREAIKDCWDNVDPDDPLEPYQRYLREAYRAHTRGDRKSERQRYRQVNRLLQVEGQPVIPQRHAVILKKEIPVLLKDY